MMKCFDHGSLDEMRHVADSVLVLPNTANASHALQFSQAAADMMNSSHKCVWLESSKGGDLLRHSHAL